MNRRSFLFVGTLIAALGAPTARADSVNVSTGLDASNNLITSGGVDDAHWSVSELTGGTGAAQTVYPNNPDWFGGWVANGPNSDWIARDANVTNNGPAPYTFFTTFTLTASELSSAAISGSWTVDDGGTLGLNGNQIGGTLSPGDWTSLQSFSVATGSSDFIVGVNTLTMTITDSDQYLEATRLEGTLTFTASAVPEPSSLVLAGTAVMAGLGLWSRRLAIVVDPREREKDTH